MISSAVNTRAFRLASVAVAIVTAYSPSALGINAFFGSVGDAIRQYARQPHGHYTTAPGTPFLGQHPGRDPHGRGGIWKAWNAKTLKKSGGHHTVALSYQAPEHTLSVAAEPGPAFPWEGSASTESASINTGNGNVLTALNLVGWKSRGMNIDFTLYHNSETSYSDELAAGWTWTYDIYINNLSGNPIVHWGDGLCIPYTAPGGGGGGGGGDDFEALHGPRASEMTGTTYTPPAGIYDQLVQNTGGTWTLTKKNGTQYQFNTSGFCNSIVDTNGNTITLTLNSSNYCTKVTDPTGKYLTINLSGSNKFTSIVDPLGRTWSFTQSGGELTNVAWPSLSGTVYSDEYTYNSGNDILTYTDKRGEVWSRSWNSDGSIAVASDPLSHETSYSYSSSATTITDPLSHVRTDNYSSGLLSSSQDESGYSYSFTSYDSNNNVLAEVDKNSDTWNYTWDSMGNKLTETDPLSHDTQYTYDSCGNNLTVVDPLGHTIKTNTFDSYGEVLTSKDALSNTTDFSWDSNGNCVTVTDPLSNVTSIGVDSLNRVVSVTDPLSHEEQTAFDNWGRVVTLTHQRV